jgi:hypothetical protein
VLKIARRSGKKPSPRLIPNDPDAKDRYAIRVPIFGILGRVCASWAWAGLPDHLWPAVRDHDPDLGLRVTSFVDPQLAVAQGQGGAVLLVSHGCGSLRDSNLPKRRVIIQGCRDGVARWYQTTPARRAQSRIGARDVGAPWEPSFESWRKLPVRA